MHMFHILLILLLLPRFGAITNGHGAYFEVLPDSNPFAVAASGCQGEYESCYYLAVGLLERLKSQMYNASLSHWKYNDICKCLFPPPPEKQPVLQFLHIPKTGTSINWFLHSYFDECPRNITHPCPTSLETNEQQREGLCNRRLFTCAGHRVIPELPSMAIEGTTKMLTLLREPWKRLQSNFHYLQTHPHSKLLEPEINTTHLLETVRSVYEFTAYPGIANCATKMLNGYQCGDSSVELSDRNLTTAKHVLSSMLFVGLSEYFKTSVCLFSWMYGGEVQPYHFQEYRRGSYDHERTAEEQLTPGQLEAFQYRERFDIELYDFAKKLFLHRLSWTGCDSID